MNIVIDNYRIRRYDSLNLCVEVHKQMGKSKTHMAEMESRKMAKLHKKMNQINPNISGI